MFKTFLNNTKKSKNVSKNKRTNAILSNMPFKNLFAASTTKGLEKIRKELGSNKRDREICATYLKRDS
jgi:hypothetical protein